MSIELIKSIDEHLHYGLWRISEAEEELREKYLPSIEELDELKGFKFIGRRLEWLASRLMFRELYKGEEKLVIRKDEQGKPFIESKDWKLSISHTREFAAAILCDFGRPVGIDIEHVNERIRKVAGKFSSPRERALVDEDSLLGKDKQLTRIWAAKEAVYKMYGLKQLDFKRDLPIIESYRDNSMCVYLLNQTEVEVRFDDYQDLVIAWCLGEKKKPGSKS